MGPTVRRFKSRISKGPNVEGSGARVLKVIGSMIGGLGLNGPRVDGLEVWMFEVSGLEVRCLVRRFGGWRFGGLDVRGFRGSKVGGSRISFLEVQRSEGRRS